ncbi:efflux RND transporter periplasmic adaptor subunit [Neptuniibacter caesariensis]|uniref:Secretion protein HlyD n=1 Tax=Neptuniibacter caesariensis TaxID=207954 RepID=A0A7U8GPY7_NEPCE|nr:HlyD family efflux transporter periplasmic adaptor subunit [Neptuniibacter caesariensis]EAR59787.1 Secretion protein HlyD [Oceanospirillum sp. MED92] [Neptuniibacter caesariensis]
MSAAPTDNRSTLIKWLLPIAILAIAIVAFIVLMKSKPQAPSRPISEKVWSVQTIAAQAGTHQPSLVLYGKVESPRMTRVTAAVTAFVEEVHTDEGKIIAPDQLLIQLDDSDARLLVDQRQADVDNYLAQIEAEKVRHQTDLKALKIEKNLLQLSLKTVRRYENLIKRKVSSQEQLDSARQAYQQQSLSLTQRERDIADHPNRLAQLESQLKRAQSLLQAANLDLQRTQIKAPFDGRVASLSVAPGDRVRAGDALIGLYSQKRLEVRAQIPNRVLPKLRQNNQDDAAIAQGSIDGQLLNLTLDRIAAEVNGGRAGVDALFRINSDTYLPEPGRSLAIEVQLPAEENLIALPPQSLYGLDRVYRVTSEGRLEAVKVERIGDSNETGKPQVLVRSNTISAGDRIITTQLPNAISGLRVKDISINTDTAAAGTGNE